MAGLTCQDLVELVTEHLEGALGVEAAHRFQEHLWGCAGCERYLRQLERTAALVGEIPVGTLSAERQVALLQALRELPR